MTDDQAAQVETLIHGCRMALGSAICSHLHDSSDDPDSADFKAMWLMEGAAMAYAGAVEAITQRAAPSVIEEAIGRLVGDFEGLTVEAVIEWLSLRDLPRPPHTYPAPGDD